MKNEDVYTRLKKEFRNNLIPRLPFILYAYYGDYPNRIIGLLSQKFKKNDLIDYLCLRVNKDKLKMPVSDIQIYKYLDYYFQNRRFSC